MEKPYLIICRIEEKTFRLSQRMKNASPTKLPLKLNYSIKLT